MDDPARTPQPAAEMTSARARRRAMRSVLDAAAASLENGRKRQETPQDGSVTYLPQELARRLETADRFRARGGRRPPRAFWSGAAAAGAERPDQMAKALAEAATLRRLGPERAAAMIGAQACASAILKEIDGRAVDALTRALRADPRAWALPTGDARPAPGAPAAPSSADPARRGAELAEIIRKTGRAALAAWAAEAPLSAAQFAQAAPGRETPAHAELARWTCWAIARAEAMDTETGEA